MQDKDDVQLLIDKFLRGELNESEAQRWAAIEANPEVQEALNWHRDVQIGVKEAGRAQLKAQFSKWDELDSKSVPKASLVSMRLYASLAVAAAVAMLIFIFWPKSVAPEESLFAQYFKPYENVVEVQVRGEASTVNNRKKAFILYEAGNHDEALLLFDGLPEADKDVDIRFYRANSHLALNQVDQAYSIFTKLAQEPNRFTSHAQWYIGLCHLKKDQMSDAKHQLEKLAQDPAHIFHGQAVKLLEELR